MGSYISCALSVPTRKHSTRGSKVVFPTGEIRHIYEPTKAAEMMMEIPNFFLVNTKSLKIGRRFSALNADEDLEMGNAYVMFPMKRVNSVVVAADLGPLFVAANSASRRASTFGNGRILPECCGSPQAAVNLHAHRNPKMEGTTVSLPKLNLDDIEELTTAEFKHRLSMSRSKKPLLETIAEEPGCAIR